MGKFKEMPLDDQIGVWVSCYYAEKDKGNNTAYCIREILKAITGQDSVDFNDH